MKPLLGGRFRVESTLGSGGHSIVFRARDELSEKPAAIKILKPEKRGRNMMRRFALEAEVLLSIDHPHIAKAIAFGEDGEQPYLALELVEGTGLRELLIARVRSGEHFSGAEIRGLFKAICAGVAHAHQLDVLHRDLKPANIIVSHLDDQRCDLRILDFGVAKLLDAGLPSEATTRGRRVGSIYHMAPEQARGEELDRRADVFSLGVIAFELVTLREPWLRDETGFPPLFTDPRTLGPGNDLPGVMERIMMQPRPRAGFFRGGVSDQLDVAIDRAMSIAPAMRPESVEVFAEELDRALATLGGRANIERFARPKVIAGDTTGPVVPGTLSISDVEASYTWVRPVTIARAPDDQTPSLDTLKKERSLLAAPWGPRDEGPPASKISAGVALAVSACAAVLACVFTISFLREAEPPPAPPPKVDAPAPVASPAVAPSAEPIVAPVIEPAVEPEPDIQPEPEPVRRAPPKKRPTPAPPRDPRVLELDQLWLELRAGVDDAAVARIGRRVAAIARSLPKSDKTASIERRATAAALSFDARALESCLLDLGIELRAPPG